ncbi:MAG: hypothetical protein E7165_00080 [Firmicutes bacterium]|nr:hypothetical protein [Bacillota bacterium]
MKKKILLSLISVCLLITLTGCKQIPKLENGQEIVASINGRDFTANELYDKLKSQGGTSIMITMIDDFIINTEIKDNDDANDYADALIAQYKASYKNAGEDFNAALISSGYENEQAFKEVLVTDYKRNEVTEKYLKEKVTEDDLKKYYDEHISDELSVKHILIAPEVSKDATKDEKTKAEKEALEKAKEIIKQLNEGADFDKLAKENSDDEATKNNGGVINNVVKEGYVTEFYNAAHALENGKYTSEPVKTEYGYHIIYKVSHTEKQKFEDIKNTLYSGVIDEKLKKDTNLEYKIWAEIREKYNITINDSTIKNIYNTTVNNINK